MLSLCFTVFVLTAVGTQSIWAMDMNRNLLDAIRYVESGGDVCAIRDNGRSLGAYLIKRNHYSAAIGANSTLTANGREYEDVWGEGSIAYSEEVLTAYVSDYATANRLGHNPTDEDIARIHHGGANGWKNSSTQEYWRKVSQAMNTQRTVPTSKNTDRCTPQCKPHQCCDRDEEGTYKCFCLQAKVNDRKEYVKRPCENCSEIAGIDVVFVLDSSGSIGSTNFQKMRNFVNKVVNDLEIGPTRTQVGVIVFSSSAFISFNLSTYSSRETLTSAVNQITYSGGGTNTAQALNLLINEGFAEARPKIQGVPRVAIVVTDGKSNHPLLTVAAAEALRREPSITTYAVGIGNANINELNAIASKRNGQNLTRYIGSFDLTELERLQEDLREQTCTASTVIDVETTPVRRQLEQETKVFLELFIPEDGFTVKVELEVGKVAVCGSNSLERPDCYYSLTYDWKLEVSKYKEVFIKPDGFPLGGNDSSSAYHMPESNVQPPNVTDEAISNTNKSVYVTIQGLEADNIFVFNTTRGDTTTIKVTAHDTIIVPTSEIKTVTAAVDTFVIISSAVGGAIVLLIIGICAACVVCAICYCTKSKKTPHRYESLPSSYAV